MTSALENSSSEWAVVFLTISKALTWEQRGSQNKAQYCDTDQILFGTVKSYGSLTYAAGLWRVWGALKRHLLLALEGNRIPAQWRIADIVHALHLFSALDIEHTLNLNKLLGQLGVTQVGHLWDKEHHY